MAKGATFAIYKGKGAAKFSLMLPKINDKGYVDRQGAIYLEVAPAVEGKRQEWDWDRKITFAIGVQDICNLIDDNMQADPQKRRIYHDQSKNPNSSSNAAKILEFAPGTADFAGTFMMRLTEKDGGSERFVVVPVTNGEYKVLRGLMTSSLPQILGWQ